MAKRNPAAAKITKKGCVYDFHDLCRVVKQETGVDVSQWITTQGENSGYGLAQHRIINLYLEDCWDEAGIEQKTLRTFFNKSEISIEYWW